MQTIIASGRQIRAARAAVGWSQTELADRAGVSRVTLSDIEGDKIDPRASTLRSIMVALERGGVELTPDGITLKR